MNRRTIRAWSLFCVAGACVSALAAPPVLDYVPRGAIMVAAVDNVGQLGGNIQNLLVALGMDETAQQVAMGSMMMGGLGIDPAGSAAIVIMDGDLSTLGQGQGPIALIARMNDYEGFVGSFGGDAGADVAQINMQGNPAFARRLQNGFVALGPDRAVVESINAAGGNAGAVAQFVGRVGRDISDESNVVLMADVQKCKPMLEDGLQRFEDGLAQAQQMGGEQGAFGAALAQTVVDGFLRDGQVGIIGLHINDAGVSIDIAAQFQEGSELAAFFARPGDASGLIARLPAVPVLLAGAFDSSHPGVRKIIANLDQMRREMLPDAGANQFMDMLQASQGGAVVVGNSAALLSSGLFSNSAVYLRTPRPAEVMAANRSAVESSNGLSQEGMTMRSSYNPGALTVAGQSVDSWSVAMQFDPNAPMAQRVQMGMMVLFGASGGPSGYITSIDSGVVGTLGMNRRLLENAMKAAREGNGLSTSADISGVSSNLRPGNIAEIYIGIGNILKTVTTAMGMFGMDMDIDLPANIGSVPIAVGSNEGGVRIRTFLSQDVIITIAELSAMAQQMGIGGGGGGGWDDDTGF